MSLVSIRLPDDVEDKLAREAQRSHRAKSEVARDAIVDYLARQERDRFRADIAKAAQARGDDEALAIAHEALPLDNEALAIAEGARYGYSVQEPRTSYRVPRKKR